MREIKFRAYWTNSDNNPHMSAKMYSWEEILNYPSSSGCPSFILSLLKNVTRDDRWKVMQFTGLKDKNEIDIYEADILKNKYGKLYLINWYDNLGYDGGGGLHSGFYFKDDLDYYTNLNELEIVGNRYQNPELLKEISNVERE